MTGVAVLQPAAVGRVILKKWSSFGAARMFCLLLGEPSNYAGTPADGVGETA